MIIDGKKWHYLFVKRSSALLKEITSKQDFYCLTKNTTKNNLNSMKICAKITIIVM